MNKKISLLFSLLLSTLVFLPVAHAAPLLPGSTIYKSQAPSSSINKTTERRCWSGSLGILSRTSNPDNISILVKLASDYSHDGNYFPSQLQCSPDYYQVVTTPWHGCLDLDNWSTPLNYKVYNNKDNSLLGECAVQFRLSNDSIEIATKTTGEKIDCAGFASSNNSASLLIAISSF